MICKLFRIDDSNVKVDMSEKDEHFLDQTPRSRSLSMSSLKRWTSKSSLISTYGYVKEKVSVRLDPICIKIVDTKFEKTFR